MDHPVRIEGIEWTGMPAEPGMPGSCVPTVNSQVYALPEGWDVERVRCLLLEHGFRRIDNHRDSLDEPHPSH